jgi:hypothetical protein
MPSLCFEVVRIRLLYAICRRSMALRLVCIPFGHAPLLAGGRGGRGGAQVVNSLDAKPTPEEVCGNTCQVGNWQEEPIGVQRN